MIGLIVKVRLHFKPFLIFLSALLLVAFVGSIFASSILRYGFSLGSVRLEDFITYTFSALILLSILVAFYNRSHVRVDVISFFQKSFDKRLARVFSSLPFFGVAFLSIPAVQFSWSILEGSSEPNGLGGLFLVKTLLPITFFVIAIFLCFGSKDTR